MITNGWFIQETGVYKYSYDFSRYSRGRSVKITFFRPRFGIFRVRITNFSQYLPILGIQRLFRDDLTNICLFLDILKLFRDNLKDKINIFF